MNAAVITRQSGSNLALAFISLTPERRQDITVFYAFCRLVDDIADSAELPLAEKGRQLTTWREALRGRVEGESPLAGDMRGLLAKYSLAPAMVDEIIDGVEMDLSISRYETWSDLHLYCYRVASAVGLVSIEIFGYRNPACREYAVDLGLALQTTNIIRDVDKDLRNGRIYLPREDFLRFGYSEEELQQRQYNDRFVELMKFEAARAWQFFGSAAQILPREDRRSMIAAEIMRSVYAGLLRRIERDRFRVFEKDYRLSKLEKAIRVAGQLLKFG
ncbi:MAG: phytoene/squalene synthase family protein [Chthoniobacterales bacterium]